MSETPVFEPYGAQGTNRGVSRYAIVQDAIHVQFHDDRVYVYTEQSPGREHVATMQRLARLGSGLSTYISQHVQHRYASRYKLNEDPSS